MEGKQFKLRTRILFFVLACLLIVFSYTLYDLQIVHGAEYLAQSSRKIATIESVPAARGEILDRYGRVLVSNKTIYQVQLNESLLGADRDKTILALTEICKQENVAWTDTLPVSMNTPFVYTLADATSTAQNRFSSFLKVMGWTDEETQAAGLLNQISTEGANTSSLPAVSADSVIAKMREKFGVDESLTDARARTLVGILYELALRSKEITWSDYIFASDVDISLITQVKEEGLTGVQIEATSVRQYHTQAAAHILGRVAQMDKDEWAVYMNQGYSMNETVGKEGVEKAFESYLHGVEGSRDIETNTGGKVVSETYINDPGPGDNVTLTLDIRLQETVETALAKYVPTLPDAQGAAVAVVNVKDGGVLALASYPTFDLANFSTSYNDIKDAPNNPLYNRATQGIYAPGSTFKMVTAVGALEENIITPADKILDTGIYTFYKDYQPMCWIYRQYHRTHGYQNVTQAITNSCNVFFYDVGRRLGIEKLEDYARLFGLGEPTGIEIPESTGVVAGPEYTESIGQRWNDGSTLAAAIGQENNQFTPLQLASYVATLVNGGDHWSVHLLSSVKSSDFSQLIYRDEGKVLDTVEIKPVNLNAVKMGMLEVTQSGSVSGYFKNLGIKVGAKTGSAQVSSASTSNAVFVCFAPYDDPEIAMAIVVEKGGSGSELGAVAADILSYYFNAKQTLESVQTEGSLLR
ncbi:hypothetical protein SDC9_66246 [bioreactor metagenome]|uniref:Peptidoglycan D,D-transpeptidase MrdA n=1 Tax=bioreactor metagenome TaxID=1076179 RepID=A0A644XUD0_9ZZZZ